MKPQTLEGPAEVAINGKVIPPTMLSEIVAEFVEGMRERTTLGGKFSRPSGVLDTAELRFTLYLPNMDYLKNIFPNRYNAPTSPQLTGNVILNPTDSATTEAGPVNVHWTGKATDDDDIFIYNGEALLNFSATINADDAVSIEVKVLAQPDENGNVARLGTGDLTKASKWDAATEATVPVTP
ncbi:hypothetical protein MPC38_06770 [Prescottella equi]|uniref:hypothetical protein n=1 Tax=Rhodococcus hoagii TaxID=43767 RepID=UPI001F5B2254|nr:hypothetical protein [Prescottella equi]UNQ40948.1 hypothetical protein MPC38_06770 [Prescottella equi]